MLSNRDKIWNSFTELNLLIYKKFLGQGEVVDSKEIEFWNKTFPIDWHLGPWLCGLLDDQKVPYEQWPSDLSGPFTNHLFRIEVMRHEFNHVKEFCENKDIDYMPLKGMWLSNEVLLHSAMRAFGDIDLWIEKKNIHQIERYFEGQGYQKTSGYRLRKAWHFHVAFFKKVHEIPIVFEIHWKLSNNRIEAFPWNDIWNHSLKKESSCERVMTKLDQALYIWYHSANHMFENPSRIMDTVIILAWLKKTGFNDWTLLDLKIQEYRCIKIMSLVSSVLEMMIGKTNVPKTSIKIKYSIIEKLAEVIKESYFQKNSSRPFYKFSLIDDYSRAFRTVFSPKRVVLKYFS